MATYTDDFDRTDSNTLGGSWVEHGDSQALQVKTNQLRMVVSTTVRGYGYYNQTIGANQYSQLVYNADDALSGPAVRIDSAGDETNATLYMAMVDLAASEVRLYKFVGVALQVSSATLLGTGSVTWAGGEVVKIQAIGSAISVLVDSVEKISVSDSSISSGFPGAAAPLKSSGFSDFGDYDDWEGGDFQSPALAEEIDFSESVGVVQGLGGEVSETVSLSESVDAALTAIDILNATEEIDFAEAVTVQQYNSLEASVAESISFSESLLETSAAKTGPGMIVLGRLGLSQADEWISDIGVRHPSRFYDGRAKFGSVRRSVEFPSGLPQVADGSFELADDDRKYRGLFDEKDPRGRPFEMRLLPEGEREAGAQQVFRGEISRVEFPEGAAKVDYSDTLLSFFDDSIPPLGTVSNFPNLPEGKEAFVPLIIGHMTGTGGLIDCPLVNTTSMRFAASRDRLASVEQVQIKRRDEDEFAATTQYALDEVSITESGVTYNVQLVRLSALNIDRDTQVRVQVKRSERNPANFLKSWLTSVVGKADSDLDLGAFAESASRATTAGYNADGAVVRSITHREFISRLTGSFNLMVFVDRWGRISCKLPTVDESTTFEVGELLTERDTVRPELPDPPYNRFRYRYLRNPAEGTWTEEIYDNDPSIADLGKVYETTLDLWFVREAATAFAVASDAAGYYDPSAKRVQFDLPGPEAVSEIEIGSQISLSHYSGVSSGGWASRKFRVVGVGMDFTRSDYLRFRVSAVSKTSPPSQPVQALLAVDWGENSIVGPYHRGGGLFFAIFLNDSDQTQLEAWKSVDWGENWTTIAGPSPAGDVEGFSSFRKDDKIHVATQEADGRTAYHRFDMLTSSWDVSDEQIRAAPASAPGDRWVDICARRSSGEPVIFGGEAKETVDGVDYLRQFAARRTSAGSWVEYAFGTGEEKNYRGGRCVPGKMDLVHFFFEVSPGSPVGTPDGHHRTLNMANTLLGDKVWYATPASWTLTTHNVGQYATDEAANGEVTIYLPVRGVGSSASIYRFGSAETMAAEKHMQADQSIAYQGEATLDGSTRYPHICVGVVSDGTVHAVWPAFVGISGDRWEVHKSTGVSGVWNPPENGIDPTGCANSLGNRCSMMNRAGALVTYPGSIQKMCGLFFDFGGSVWLARFTYHQFSAAQRVQLGISGNRRTVFELLKVDRDIPRAASWNLQALVDALAS